MGLYDLLILDLPWLCVYASLRYIFDGHVTSARLFAENTVLFGCLAAEGLTCFELLRDKCAESYWMDEYT